MNKNKKVYLFVRSDLTVAQAVVQVAHVAFKLGGRISRDCGLLRQEFDYDGTPFVLVAVDDEAALLRRKAEIMDLPGRDGRAYRGIVESFYEPDREGGSYTAFAVSVGADDELPDSVLGGPAKTTTLASLAGRIVDRGVGSPDEAKV